MNNPFSNALKASQFKGIESSGTRGALPGGPSTEQGAGDLSPGSPPVLPPARDNTGSGGGGGGSSGGSSGGGGGSGGSGGGSGGGGSSGGDPYAGMPDWLREYYTGGSSQFGSDGFFTGGHDLMSILFGEAGQMQDAADRHWDLTEGRLSDFESFLNGIQGRYEDSRLDTSLRPEDYASVRRAEEEYSAFRDRTAQDISSTVAGYQAQFQSSVDSVNSGMRADGSMMTAQEQADARFGLSQQMGIAQQQATTGIMTAYNREKAALGMQVASMTNQAEQLHQQAQIVNAANQMKALELESAGRGALAQLTLNNPETVVSVLGGLMALNEHGAALHMLFGSQSGNMEGDLRDQYRRFQEGDHNAYGSGQGTSHRWWDNTSFEDWLSQNGYGG